MSTQAAVLEWESDGQETIKSQGINEWATNLPVVSVRLESGSLEAEIESAKNRLIVLNDNWDGEGSPGYEEETLDRAKVFLKAQDELFRDLCGIKLPVPQINPGPDGSIDLFWDQPTLELLVNIPANSTQEASFYGEDRRSHIKGSFDTSERGIGVVFWLMR